MNNKTKCPCCGKYALTTITARVAGVPMWYHTMCLECLKTGPLMDTEKEAVEAFYERWSE